MPGAFWEIRGGAISSSSSCHVDQCRLALLKQKNSCNVEGLANPHHHGGIDGYDPLTKAIIHNCGYTELNTTDVLNSYLDIIILHRTIYKHWVNTRTQYEGPQLNQILEKGIPTFTRLSTLEVESVVEFYNKLQKTTSAYLLPIMPFDCTLIQMGIEALCPPGLGAPKYAAIARVLLEVLPKLLTKCNTQINTLITVVCMELNNRYDLLWHVMALALPGFDPAIPYCIPVWRDNDIFKFASSFLLCYCLHLKKGVYHNNCTRSLTFLQAITKPAYTDGMTSLLTCMSNYYAAEDDGYLPSHLCIMGLTTQIHKTATTRVASTIPLAHRTQGPPLPADSVNHQDTRSPWAL
jgi:hypothetical protein